MSRSKLPYIFLGIAAALAVSALVLLVLRPGVDDGGQGSMAPAKPPVASTAGESTASSTGDTEVAPALPPATENAAAPLDELGVGLATGDPTELLNRIAKALEAGDLDLIGSVCKF